MYHFSAIDMLPYLLMAGLILLFNNLKTKPVKKAEICFYAILFFASIRYGVGYDYLTYKKIVLREADAYIIDNVEPLSKLLMDIGFYTHYQVYFILSSILTLYPIFKACVRYSINPAYSLLSYFLFPQFYLESQSIVRNAIAFSFVLFAYLKLMDRAYMKSLFLIGCAVLFHKSAVIGILIYPLYWASGNRKLHIVGYIISFLCTVLVMRFVGAYADQISLLSAIEGYAEGGRSEGGTMTFILNGIAIFNLVFWNRLVCIDQNNTHFLGLYNLGICLWNIFLGVDSTIALRFSSFFIISVLFLFPCYKYLFSKHYRYLAYRGTTGFLLVLFLSYFYLCISSYIVKPERMSNLPYQTVFFYNDYNNYQPEW